LYQSILLTIFGGSTPSHISYIEMNDVETKRLEAEVLNLRFKEVHDKLEEVSAVCEKILEQVEHINDNTINQEKRISHLEETHRYCPVSKVKGDFEEFKKKASLFIYLVDHPKVFWTLVGLLIMIINYTNIKDIIELLKSL